MKECFFFPQCYIFWGKFIYWYAEKKERHPSRPTATVRAIHRYATQPTAACIQITAPLEIRRKTRVTLKIPSTWHQASRRPAASGAKNTNEVNNRFWTPLALQHCSAVDWRAGIKTWVEMHQDEGFRKETSELLLIENRVPTFTPVNNQSIIYWVKKPLAFCSLHFSESVCQSTSVWKSSPFWCHKG